MFAKGLREDTEFGDGSDTAEGITRLIINSPWRPADTLTRWNHSLACLAGRSRQSRSEGRNAA